jgi:hypothetical protein
MSLAEFQRAFADHVASPARCLDCRQDSGRALAEYDLTDRERARLRAIVADRAMTANCILYRVNRLVPVYSVLPRTCRMLGDRLFVELDGYWSSCEASTFQYGLEAVRFGRWLLDRMRTGTLDDGPVSDVLAFEIAAFELATERCERAARRRVLEFRFDPTALLSSVMETRELFPLARPRIVVLDWTGDEPVVEVRRDTAEMRSETSAGDGPPSLRARRSR